MARRLDEYLEELKARLPRERGKIERAERSFDLIGQLLVLRLGGGLTQMELAERSGIPQSEISKIENGRIQPTVETLQALGGALGARLAFALMEPRRAPAPGSLPALPQTIFNVEKRREP